jgi:NAD(P)H-hydrate epimerase
MILTPHTGELSGLIGWEVAAIERDRLGAVRAASDRYAAVVVLKGAHTLTAEPEGEVWVNMTGNPGMATPGSGDVLAGVIAAMIGLGLPPGDAARTGALLHGLAGDIAARGGEDGLIARDIASALPEALRRLRAEPDTCWRDRIRLLD